MRLELADFPVKEIRFGSGLRYGSGLLEMNEQDLKALVLQDHRVQEVEFAVVLPGEKARVTGVRDVVEPRVKVGGEAQVFPGVLGPVVPVGGGRTHRLSGMGVVATAEYEGTIRTGTAAQRSGIIDMWGPGAEVCPFSPLVNLIMILKLVQGLPEIEAHTAIQQAEYRVAQRLAEATAELEPNQMDVYDLESSKRDLPRVVLIVGCLTESATVPSNVSYYGFPIRESLASAIHPNELIDGAVTGNTIKANAYYPTTWHWQNHPLALGLYREHGQKLNLIGVILERVRFVSFPDKEVAAHNASQIASLLKADAAIITWLGSGNAFIDVSLTVKACERQGIKTVLVTYEYGGKDGLDSPLLYYVPENNAVVSTGSRDRWLELPAPERVVGPYENIHAMEFPGAPRISAKDPLSLDARDLIIGGIDLWGRSTLTCRAY
jgi:glycine reductase